MADFSKIARPYAKAVFLLAERTDSLAQWSERLEVLGQIAQAPAVIQLMKNPKCDNEAMAALFINVAGSVLNPEAERLIKLLSEQKRLACLPEMVRIYGHYKTQKEQVVEVELTAATPVEQSYQQTIQARLAERLNCQISLHCKTDPRLIAGAVVRAGDYVIDGSVKGRLEKLKESIVI